MKIKLNYSHPYDFKGLFSLDKIVEMLPKYIELQGCMGIKAEYVLPFKVLSVTSYEKESFKMWDLFETFFIVEIMGKQIEITQVHGLVGIHEMIGSLKTKFPDERIENELATLVSVKHRIIEKAISETLTSKLLNNEDLSEYEMDNETQPEIINN